MRGSSAESYARLAEGLTAGSDQIGDELLAATGVLREQVALRRAATDPTRPAEARSELLRRVFAEHLGGDAAEVVGQAGGLRWTSSVDLPDALERLGVRSIVLAARDSGEADRVEDELFAFGRVVATDAGLRDALSDPARSAADKRGLIRDLLEGKATHATIRLAEESVSGIRRTVSAAIDDLVEIVADALGRTVATVRTASALNDDQLGRLAAALGRELDSEVHLNVIVDPRVLGGVRVELGDHVIDGTVVSRLDDVRRRIAG